MTRSEQARADALADAETLRLEMRSQAVATMGETSTGGMTTYGARLNRDANCCNAAWFLTLAKEPNYLTIPRGEEVAASMAFNDARAAFRAVPGLRGE